jgi:hypothetical protein
VIVARVLLQGDEHLAVALSLDERQKLETGEITSLDLDRFLSENLHVMMAFDKRITKIAVMTKEVLETKLVPLDPATYTTPEPLH